MVWIFQNILTKQWHDWIDYWSVDFDYESKPEVIKFKTSKGFRSFYSLDLPVISNTNTLTNSYSFKHYTELYEENITTTSFLIRTANSLTNEDIKLSERLFLMVELMRLSLLEDLTISQRRLQSLEIK